MQAPPPNGTPRRRSVGSRPPPKWDTPNFLDLLVLLAFLLVLLAFALVFLCFCLVFLWFCWGGAAAPRTIHRGGRRRSAGPAYVPQGGRRRGADPAYVPQGGAGGGAKQRKTKQNQRKSKQNQSKTKPSLNFQGVSHLGGVCNLRRCPIWGGHPTSYHI